MEINQVSEFFIFPTKEIHLLRSEISNSPNAASQFKFRAIHTETLLNLCDSTNLLSSIVLVHEPVIFSPHPELIVVSRDNSDFIVGIKPGTSVSGTNYIIITLKDSNNLKQQIVVRVQVHEDIAKNANGKYIFGCGDRKITTYEPFIDKVNTTHYFNTQLSIYAKFKDSSTESSIGDITSHPFIGYELINKPGVSGTLLSINNYGILKGLSKGPESLTEHVKVKVSLSSDFDTIEVKVEEKLLKLINGKIIGTRKKLIKYNYNSNNKTNILVVGEGFLSDSKFVSDFVKPVVDNILDYEPFTLLKDEINFWSLIDPCFDEGVSIFSPLNDNSCPTINLPSINKIPNDTTVVSADFYPIYVHEIQKELRRIFLKYGIYDILNKTSVENEVNNKTFITDNASINSNLKLRVIALWTNSKITKYVINKDTRLGLGIGNYRFGEGYSIKNTTSNNIEIGNFYNVKVLDFSTVYPDWRRNYITTNSDLYPYKRDRLKFIEFYFDSLSDKDGSTEILGNHWKNSLESNGLVACILNQGFNSGFTLKVPDGVGFIATAIDPSKEYIKTKSNPIINDLLFDYSNEAPLNLNGENGAHQTLVHELLHGFDLGEEYEDIRSESNFDFDKLDKHDSYFNKIQAYPNNETLQEIRIGENLQANETQKIDYTKIKWDWPRIDNISRIKGTISRITVGNLVDVIKVEFFNPDHFAKWATIFRIQPDRNVYLRTWQFQKLKDLRNNIVFNGRHNFQSFGDTDEFFLSIVGISDLLKCIYLRDSPSVMTNEDFTILNKDLKPLLFTRTPSLKTLQSIDVKGGYVIKEGTKKSVFIPVTAKGPNISSAQSKVKAEFNIEVINGVRKLKFIQLVGKRKKLPFLGESDVKLQIENITKIIVGTQLPEFIPIYKPFFDNIEKVIVIDSGYGYKEVPKVVIKRGINDTNTTDRAEIDSVVMSNDLIYKIEMENKGSNFIKPLTIIIKHKDLAHSDSAEEFNTHKNYRIVCYVVALNSTNNGIKEVVCVEESKYVIDGPKLINLEIEIVGGVKDNATVTAAQISLKEGNNPSDGRIMRFLNPDSLAPAAINKFLNITNSGEGYTLTKRPIIYKIKHHSEDKANLEGGLIAIYCDNTEYSIEIISPGNGWIPSSTSNYIDLVEGECFFIEDTYQPISTDSNIGSKRFLFTIPKKMFFAVNFDSNGGIGSIKIDENEVRLNLFKEKMQLFRYPVGPPIILVAGKTVFNTNNTSIAKLDAVLITETNSSSYQMIDEIKISKPGKYTGTIGIRILGGLETITIPANNSTAIGNLTLNAGGAKATALQSTGIESITIKQNKGGKGYIGKPIVEIDAPTDTNIPSRKTAKALASITGDSTLINSVIKGYLSKSKLPFDNNPDSTKPRNISKIAQIPDLPFLDINSEDSNPVVAKYKVEFEEPHPAYYLPAIFEGAGKYNKNIYRPSLFSVMRSAEILTYEYNKDNSDVIKYIPKINYVCMYYIVNRVNPEKLPKLDEYYEKYCGKIKLK